MKAFSGKFKRLVTYDSVHAEALSVSLSQITSESLLCNSVPVQIDGYTYTYVLLIQAIKPVWARVMDSSENRDKGLWNKELVDGADHTL